MSFNWFVLPFAIGFHFMLIVLIISFISGFAKLSSKSRKRVFRRLFTRRLFYALQEIMMESLLHRKLFKVNLLLGLMHTAFAFGWFMLIVVGKIETHLLTQSWINPVWVPIFLRRGDLFNESMLSKSFANVMDFILLLILIALVVAIGKRFFSKSVGMKGTTQHDLVDRLAMSFLWAIFPLRFLAESGQASISNNGGFLTQTASSIFFSTPLSQSTADLIWWSYSFALGGFFIFLPYSRYLHIPAEIILIFARNLLSNNEFHHPMLRQLENNSCSRCGVCIDVCAQRTVNRMDKNQSVYLLRSLRRKNFNHEAHFDLAFNCLQCNKCSSACPVGINLMPHRNHARGNYSLIGKTTSHYRPIVETPLKNEAVDVLYFEGCMGRLNHRTGKAMERVFEKLNMSYIKLDDSINCCGRGAQLLADKRNIKEVMAKNSEIINNSNAKMLVTSCPICYKSFKENYSLKMTVLHHSQLIAKSYSRLKTASSFDGKAHYHTPCELGKWNDVKAVSNSITKQLSYKLINGKESEESICCGGSIGNLTIDTNSRKEIGTLEISRAISKDATAVVTSCPLCKRSLAKLTNLPILDIAETVV